MPYLKPAAPAPSSGAREIRGVKRRPWDRRARVRVAVRPSPPLASLPPAALWTARRRLDRSGTRSYTRASSRTDAMTAMRAREQQGFLDEEFPLSVPLVTVRAGESLVLRIGAIDRQSGLSEIIARCRSRDNHDLASAGRWIAGGASPPPSDHYYPVLISIPSHS